MLRECFLVGVVDMHSMLPHREQAVRPLAELLPASIPQDAQRQPAASEQRQPKSGLRKGLSGRYGAAVERARRADQQHKSGGHRHAKQFLCELGSLFHYEVGYRLNYDMLHDFPLLATSSIATMRLL